MVEGFWSGSWLLSPGKWPIIKRALPGTFGSISDDWVYWWPPQAVQLLSSGLGLLPQSAVQHTLKDRSLSANYEATGSVGSF